VRDVQTKQATKPVSRDLLMGLCKEIRQGSLERLNEEEGTAIAQTDWKTDGSG
jgi:hypothetical protein